MAYKRRVGSGTEEGETYVNVVSGVRTAVLSLTYVICLFPFYKYGHCLKTLLNCQEEIFGYSQVKAVFQVCTECPAQSATLHRVSKFV
jgi:hypothetical protein